ncbi:MAG: transporter substrate-binding domain-containing protein, partial [Clostridia bacterium]
MKKGNLELLTKIENAMSHIFITNPKFLYDLRKKYFGNQVSRVLDLTDDEIFVLSQKPKLRFLVTTDGGYSSRLKDGEYVGIDIDIIKEISRLLNIDYEICKYNSIKERDEIFNNRQFDIVACFSGDSKFAQEVNLILSAPYCTKVNYLISRDVTNEAVENPRLALPTDTFKVFGEIIPEKEQSSMKLYETTEQCLNAILNEEADYTIIDNFVAEFYLNKSKYSSLKMSQRSSSEKVFFAVSNENSRLLVGILNKTIAYMGEDYLDDIITKNVSDTVENDVLTYFEDNLALAIILAIVALAFMILITSYIVLVIIDRNKRKKLNRSNQAKERFLKYMSKEITQPIDDVKKMLSLIEHNSKKGDLEYINNAKVSINLLSDMMVNFKNYAALESGEVTLNERWFTREECIIGIESMLQSLYLEKNIKLTLISSQKDHKYSKLDYPKLMQILINIVSNSIKYTPENGEIEIIAKGLNFDGT